MNRQLLIVCCSAALIAGWFAGKFTRPASDRVALPSQVETPPPPGPQHAHSDLSALTADPSPDALVLLAARISQLDADEIVERLRDLDRYDRAPDGKEHLFAVAIIDRLISLDSERALGLVPTVRPSLGQLMASSLGRAAAGRDALTAQNWAARLPDRVDDAQFWGAFGAHAPPAVFMALPEGSTGANLARWRFIRRWGDEDPAACVAWAAAHPRAWADAAAAMARKDPHAALAWVESLSGKGSRAAARNGVYEGWAARDPLAALAAFLEESAPGANLQSQAITYHLSSLPLETVLPAAAAAPGATVIRDWMSRWTSRNPAALVDALFQMPESAARQDLIRMASRDWQRTVSAEARDAIRRALESEPPGDVRDVVAKAYIEASARAGDPDSAFAWLESEIPATEREESARGLASALSGSDPAALAANIDRIPVAARPPRQAMLQTWQMIDPAAAKAWAAEHPEE
jgi:hypothetical protein